MRQLTITTATIDEFNANLIDTRNQSVLIGYAIDYLKAFMPISGINGKSITEVIDLVNSPTHCTNFAEYLNTLDRV